MQRAARAVWRSIAPNSLVVAEMGSAEVQRLVLGTDSAACGENEARCLLFVVEAEAEPVR